MESILTISTFTYLFSTVDAYLTKKRFKNPYYAIHALHNALIVAATAGDVWNTFTDYYNLMSYKANWSAAYLCIALHLYHCIAYWRTFRTDDWLHHILMIGVGLPLGLWVNMTPLLGFSLFFTTGLPGGIDYALLFGVRNGWIDRLKEKRINDAVNVWIRAPGCTAMAALSTPSILRIAPIQSEWKTMAMVLPAILNYWNGQYFMRQVVENRVLCDKEAVELSKVWGGEDESSTGRIRETNENAAHEQ
jgi:hypothetical protein